MTEVTTAIAASAVQRPATAGPADVLLRIVGLRTHIFRNNGGVVKAVDGVDLTINRGQSVGLVGESGSGKSMTCMSIMRRLPVRHAHIVAGEIWFDGIDLVAADDRLLRNVRGKRIGLIMQDSTAALNPVLRIGEQIAETLRYHSDLSRTEARARAAQSLESVRVADPWRRLKQYVHQLSGGTAQRVGAAMGLVAYPELLIADEATTALDVTTQADFLKLVRGLQVSTGLSLLWVTHDLGVVAQVCDRVNIMYAGHIVESGNVRRIFRRPLHPYTAALLKAVPTLGAKRERLHQIAGQPPDLANLGPGCPFYDRCSNRKPICRQEFPVATSDGEDGAVHCWAPEGS